MENNSFSNTNILIVGGAGFVGSNLVRQILKNSTGVKITVIDNLLSAERLNIPDSPHVSFIEGSITNDRILGNLTDEFDYIFHLSTYHGNQSSIHDPLMDHENNTLTTLKLFDKVRNFKRIKKIVYSSAGCSVAKKTFEDAKPTTEDDPIELKQDSPYSISKIVGEFYALYYFNQYKLPTVRARFQNVYGPGEILGAGQWRGTPATVWRNVTPTFIYKALHNEALPVENNGIASRDFIYVEDICIGLMACAVKGKPGDVYNIASGYEKTIMDLALLINELTGSKAGIYHLPKRAWDNSGKRYGSSEKSFRELDFKATIELRAGLMQTINWTKQNINLIQQNIDKHKKHLNQA